MVVLFEQNEAAGGEAELSLEVLCGFAWCAKSSKSSNSTFVHL